jgi:hypothetical protein
MINEAKASLAQKNNVKTNSDLKIITSPVNKKYNFV